MSGLESRCECRGSTGKKIGYHDERVIVDVQQRLSQELGKPLYIYDCPQGNGQHLSRMSPERCAAQLVKKLEHTRRTDAFDRTLVLSTAVATSPLDQLMWRADHLATQLRGEVAHSRDDLVNLVYHPSQGWQASAPIKQTCSRQRWVRARALSAEDAVIELIRLLELKQV